MLLATGFPAFGFSSTRDFPPDLLHALPAELASKMSAVFLSHLKGLYGGLHFTLALYYYLRGRSTVRQGNGGLAIIYRFQVICLTYLAARYRHLPLLFG